MSKFFSFKEVAKHTSAEDCWVIHNSKIYDVSGFVADHPGGEEFILDHAGKDVTALMKDELEHLHSEGAYEMLDELLIGQLENTTVSQTTTVKDANGKVTHRTTTTTTTTTTSATTATKDSAASSSSSSIGSVANNDKDHDGVTATDIVADVKKEKFLDLSKPLLYQLWKANYPKDFYMKQVHIPRHLPYSARVFESDFLEIFSRTPWWLVPILWLPVVGLMFSWAIQGEEAQGALSLETAGSTFLAGVLTWSLAEYSIHRFLFHVDDLLPDSTYSNVAHFLLHGIHHYLPMDRLRLVMPPVLTIFLGTPLYLLAHSLLESHMADALMAGVYFGYICYDMIHYYLHHARVLEFHFKEMKTYHLAHHYKNYDNGYGITSKLWDRVFGTLLEL
ncbi:fatty acid alpha-hydroxylase [Mortierella claussenii]|nr:fatty acid alpha-hydroxylase [Mortierella claussenii]